MLFLIENSYFTVRNILILPTLGILMRIQLALFWGNFYLYNYVSKYITNLIRTNKVRNRRLHSTFRFIEDLGALNDVGEFGRDFYEIYSKELELKMEHNGSHEIFLDLDVSIDKVKFIDKIYDKLESSNFHIARMSSITSSILSTMFHSSFLSELVRIAWSTLLQ